MRPQLWLVTVTCLLPGAGGCSGTAPTGPTGPGYLVSGTVVDVETSRPVTSAVVTVLDGTRAGTAAKVDADGVYRLFLMTGSPRLEIRAPDYEVKSFQVGPLAGDATADVTLQRDLTSFTGRVTEAAPTQQVAIAGARIEVISGPRAGQMAVSADDGTFPLTGLSGATDIVVRAAGYEEARVRLNARQADIGLKPILRMLKKTVGDRLGPKQQPTSFFVDVHHAGMITVSELYFYFHDGSKNARTVEIWDGSRLVASGTTNMQAWHGVVISARVEGGARYEIRILGGEWTYVVMEWPN